jgi:uncharacterized protein (TIGR02271 family)
VSDDQRTAEGAPEVEPVDQPGVDSGEIETLSGGSISIPVVEEQIVVTKRPVVRERIVIRKDVETRTERVEDDLRRERVEAQQMPGEESSPSEPADEGSEA